jgi:DNA-binding IclR family transcriptional regulator
LKPLDTDSLTPQARNHVRRKAALPSNWTSGLQSVNRTLDVLDLLSHGSTAVGEAARALSVNKSTASRMLATMAARGYVARHPVSGLYRLGPKIAELHAAYLSNRRLGRDASFLLDRLAAATGETILLTAFDSGEAVYIDKVESEHPLRTSSSIGQRGPLHAGAAGKSILAVLSPQEVDRLLGTRPIERLGPRGVTNRQELERELELTRRRGYAVSIEEINEGIVGVGVALLAPDGYPLGAISVTGPTARFGEKRIREVAAALVAARVEWQAGMEIGGPSRA